MSPKVDFFKKILYNIYRKKEKNNLKMKGKKIMNKHFITITITTDTNVSRDDMIDYFTALMLDGDAEMPFDPRGIIIDASRTSTEFGNGVCVYGKAD